MIYGLDGGNLRSAIAAYETMRVLPADGQIGPQVISAIGNTNQIIGSYVITANDLSTVVGAIPKDYAQMAQINGGLDNPVIASQFAAARLTRCPAFCVASTVFAVF